MPLPTCECVKAQTQTDKLKSIYCVARQLAGEDPSLPTCDCANGMTKSSLLTNIYCAFLIWSGL